MKEIRVASIYIVSIWIEIELAYGNGLGNLMRDDVNLKESKDMFMM